MFGVDLSVYNKTVDKQSTFSSYRLLCTIPNTPRWEKFKKLPNIGGYVQVTGEIVGLCDIRNRRSICVLIADLSFLPSSLKPPTSITPSTTASPETPRKRLRQRGEPPALLQQTPSNRRPEKSLTPTSSEGEDEISCSPRTEPAADGGNDGEGSSSKDANYGYYTRGKKAAKD
jgi:hypothetical protein